VRPSAPDLAVEANPPARHDDVHIDYLSGRHEDAEAALELLEHPVEIAAGPAGCRRRFTDRYGAEAWLEVGGARPHKIQFPGRALERIRRETGTDEPLVRRMNDLRIHATRCDLARDAEGPPSANYFATAYLQDRYLSRASAYPVGFIGSEDLSWYAGSSGADVQVCAYGKTAKLRADGVADVLDDVNRVEMRFRNRRARDVLDEIAAKNSGVDPKTGEVAWDLHGIFRGRIAALIRITERPVDKANKNHGRSRLDAVWRQYVGDAPTVVRTSVFREHGAPVDDARRLLQDLDRSAAPRLSAVLDAAGSTALVILADAGRARRSATVEDLVRNHRDALYQAFLEYEPVRRRAAS
jgi:hypothetical protein